MNAQRQTGLPPVPRVIVSRLSGSGAEREGIIRSRHNGCCIRMYLHLQLATGTSQHALCRCCIVNEPLNFCDFERRPQSARRGKPRWGAADERYHQRDETVGDRWLTRPLSVSVSRTRSSLSREPLRSPRPVSLAGHRHYTV
ncbi:hypothetical protein EVAR_55727_1 [Eumeta japonica]|uniref:Uncharacterized protein n=1 Tax=Eumeta variegata TaxID=151549 RepID=A0A4C1YXM0_EUMVA|nr:hypothetical protein EVAR_55727_1 [Eumeta japonica]